MRDRKVESLPDFKNKNLTLLSTIHSLKGLEFDYIIFPRSETSKIDFFADDDINMNMFFVLFSRAKKVGKNALRSVRWDRAINFVFLY